MDLIYGNFTNTPRNRLLKFALEKGAQLPSESPIRKKCRDYASLLYRMGVVGDLPDRATLSKEVYGINDKDDRQAVAAAKLLLDMSMPDDQVGTEPLLAPDASDKWLRRLFEHAIRGFYGVVASDRWRVSKGNIVQDWPASEFSENAEQVLPKMKLDIVLESKAEDKKIVIDTKFTGILKPGWYRDNSLFSDYLYQMYSYLRSQEESGKSMDKDATGILLHPVTEKAEKFFLTMQGHRFIFATVNLNSQATEIRKELLELIQ